ncbi:hypothetical protein NL676_036070 [Syzygium grande]|nr:hypothetical protein NL676_036070 [Syzygium grande]
MSSTSIPATSRQEEDTVLELEFEGRLHQGLLHIPICLLISVYLMHFSLPFLGEPVLFSGHLVGEKLLSVMLFPRGGGGEDVPVPEPRLQRVLRQQPQLRPSLPQRGLPRRPLPWPPAPGSMA